MYTAWCSSLYHWLEHLCSQANNAIFRVSFRNASFSCDLNHPKHPEKVLMFNSKFDLSDQTSESSLVNSYEQSIDWAG